MLSLQYHRSNSFLFVNGIKICQFKAKNSEMKHIGTISKDFTVKILKKKKKKKLDQMDMYITILILITL